MRLFRNRILPILLAALWISLSEFFRNEFLLKSLWTNHYQQRGLVFPSEPVNGALWGFWSLLFAVLIFTLSRKFSLLQTSLLSWYAGFGLMWVTIGNLGVLPSDLLVVAFPLSLLESFVATWLICKTSAPAQVKH